MTTRLALRERLKVIRKWSIKFESNPQVLYWLTCTHFTAFSWNMHWIFARITRWTWYASTFYFIGLKQERTKQSKQGFKFACFCDFCLFVCKIVSWCVQCYVRGKLATPGSYLWTPVFPKSFPRIPFETGLMCDYVTCPKFTTKPRLCHIYPNFRCPRVVFTWIFFSSWLLWE